MHAELINTGSELMLGFVTNTNQQWLCRELGQRGYEVTRQVAVPDQAHRIQEAAREALGRAPLVICTGGLGPTSDDLTRECIAELFGCPLQEDPVVLEAIAAFFQVRRRPMPPRTRVQALVPEGALVLRNRNGTAPGLALTVAPGQFGRAGGPGLFIMLPGPPRELEPMFSQEVIPLLQQRFPPPEATVCRVLRTTGLGESVVEEKISVPLRALVQAGLELGYCARFGEVDVRLVARGSEAAERVAEGEQIVRELLGKYVFSGEGESLEVVLIRKLAAARQTVALAESCTGGYIANRLTNVPGASAVFVGGFVTYSNESKQTCLGVAAETLAQQGAVSEAAAREMAEGARRRLAATYALAVTGIAGPGGGSSEKPVGTVFIGLAGAGTTVVLHRVNAYDRESFKQVTSQQALDLLRRKLQA